MQLTTALIVDEVRKHPDGRVDLIGLYEDIFVGELPVTLERITLYLDLDLEADDRGRAHRIDLLLTEASGKPVGDVFPIRFTVPSEKDLPLPSVQLDPDFTDVTFHRSGLHYIELRVDGKLARRLRISVGRSGVG